MNITTITKEDFEADDILATLADAGRRGGFRRPRRVRRPRHDPARQRPRDAALPERARGLRAQALRRGRRARALRHRTPSSILRSPPSSARRATTLPGIDKVGEKTAVKWITQYGSLDGILEHADEIGGVVGNNLREQRDRAERNRRLNRLVTDRRAPGRPGGPRARPHGRAPRSSRSSNASSSAPSPSACSRSRPRRAPTIERRGRRAPRRPPTRPGRPHARRRGAARRGWPAPPTRRGGADRPRGGCAGRRALRASASPRRPTPRTSTGPRTVPTTRPSRSGSRRDAPKVLVDGKRAHQQSSPPRASPSPASRGMPTSPPGSSARGRAPRRLGELVGDILGESLPQAGPEPARARHRGAVARHRAPGTCARVADAQRERLDAGERDGARDDRAAAGSRPREHGAHGNRRRPRRTHRAQRGAGRDRGRPRREGLRRDRPRGQPRLAEAAAAGALRGARHAEDPSDQDRVLDGCRSPRRPAGASTRTPSSTFCCSTATRRSCARSWRRLQKATDDRGAHPHDLRADGHDDRAHLVDRPESAEHPRRVPRWATASAPRSSPGTATRGCSPPTTRRSRCASWRTSPATRASSRPSRTGEDLHRFVGARIFGVEPSGRHAGDAHEGQGDELRARLRTERVRSRRSSCASRRPRPSSS